MSQMFNPRDLIARNDISPDFVPQNEEDFIRCLASWEWRIYSGCLYKIMIKDEDDENDEGFVAPFVPNQAQHDFLTNLHNRNCILKARQLGFTTVAAVVWNDHALFQADQRCVIIAHTKDDASAILKDKVKFAYENMPAFLRAEMPTTTNSKTEVHYGHNNSSIRVAVSGRGGTIHRLHVSEMGKIAAKHPERALEIVTGSLPTVPKSGITVMESTAEGQSGEFYRIAQKAEANARRRTKLKHKQWKFFFYPWHSNPDYTVDPEGIDISPAEHKYFNLVEITQGVDISLGQRAWYVMTRDDELGGDAEKMWREYPSSPDECWKKTNKGTYYAAQIARCQSDGRVRKLPLQKHIPVNTFWDIGSSDGTAIWLHQQVGSENWFIDYIEAHEREYSYFIKELQSRGHLWGTHFLPHDATQKRQQADVIASPEDMLRDIARDWKWRIVPRVDDIQHGISLTRQKFSTAVFDSEKTKEGFEHLTLYHKKFNRVIGDFIDVPEKYDGHSESADAFRQWAQAWDDTAQHRKRRKKRRATGMGS